MSLEYFITARIVDVEPSLMEALSYSIVIIVLQNGVLFVIANGMKDWLAVNIKQNSPIKSPIKFPIPIPIKMSNHSWALNPAQAVKSWLKIWEEEEWNAIVGATSVLNVEVYLITLGLVDALKGLEGPWLWIICRESVFLEL